MREGAGGVGAAIAGGRAGGFRWAADVASELSNGNERCGFSEYGRRTLIIGAADDESPPSEMSRYIARRF